MPAIGAFREVETGCNEERLTFEGTLNTVKGRDHFNPQRFFRLATYCDEVLEA